MSPSSEEQNQQGIGKPTIRLPKAFVEDFWEAYRQVESIAGPGELCAAGLLLVWCLPIEEQRALLRKVKSYDIDKVEGKADVPVIHPPLPPVEDVVTEVDEQEHRRTQRKRRGK